MHHQWGVAKKQEWRVDTLSGSQVQTTSKVMDEDNPIIDMTTILIRLMGPTPLLKLSFWTPSARLNLMKKKMHNQHIEGTIKIYRLPQGPKNWDVKIRHLEAHDGHQLILR